MSDKSLKYDRGENCLNRENNTESPRSDCHAKISSCMRVHVHHLKLALLLQFDEGFAQMGDFTAGVRKLRREELYFGLPDGL